MKTKILSYILVCMAAFGLASCSESWEPKLEKTGQVALSSMGVEVRGAETIARGEYNINDFLVKIYEAGSKETEVASWTYAKMPEIFTLPIGSYRVDVMSHELLSAEWEKPYYLGSADFDIKDGEITAIGNIVCKFASLRVSVRFSDNLIAAAGSDVNVKVEAGDLGTLTFTPAETRSGYFEVVDGSTTMAAYFEGTVRGYNEKLHKVYSDVAAGQHRIITFTLKGEVIDPTIESGVIDITDGINISAVMSEESLNGSVDPSEETSNPERPGEENFRDQFEMEYAAADGTVAVSCPEALSALVLTFVSDNKEATDEFASVNGVDLLAPGESASALGKYNISVAESRATNVTVNLAGLVEAAKEYEGSHTIGLMATSESGEQQSASIAVKGGASSEDAITFTTDLDFEGTNSVNIDRAVVVIGAEAGIAHLNVTISSDNQEFLGSAGELLPLQFDLATVSGTTADNLASIGLPVGDDVKGKTSVDFNISDLVPLLQAFPGTHRFTIAVEDMSGNSASRTLTFVAL